MLKIFTQLPKIETAISYPSRFDNIKTILNLNIKNIIRYNLINNHQVLSSNIFVKILNSITIPFDISDEYFYESMLDRAVKLSMSYNLTSIYSKGKVFNNEVYSDCNNEILYYHSDVKYNIKELIKNWIFIEPVKVLHHEYSDISYGFNYETNTSNLNVIIIDIVLLALKYKAFLQSKEFKIKSINIFVAKFVYPFMLKQHIDLCLFNKLHNKFLNNKIQSKTYRHKLSIVNMDRQIDSVINEVLTNIEKSNKNYRIILNSLPSIYNKNIYESLLLPNTLACIQSDWVLVLSRLKHIDFLLSIGKGDILINSTEQINEITRSLKRNNVNQLINKLDNLDYYKSVLNKILNV